MIALVTVSNGLLGQKIIEQLKNKVNKIIATSEGSNRNPNNSFIYEDLDITNKEQLENSKFINIIDDEFRAPTLADDLAYACIYSAKNKVFGVYHTSGKDIMSIYDMVICIANYFNLDKNLVNRISSKELSQVANRPKKTGFVLEKAKKQLNYHPKSFNDSLQYIDKQLTNQNN